MAELRTLPEPAHDLDRLLEHLQPHVGLRPAVAEDVLVERLAAADAEREAALEQDGRRRGRLGDDRGVDPDGRARHRGRHVHGRDRAGERADHRPHERALALLVDPGVVVVGDPQAIEAGVLGQPRLVDQLVRTELLAGQEVADAHAVALPRGDGDTRSVHSRAPAPGGDRDRSAARRAAPPARPRPRCCGSRAGPATRSSRGCSTPVRRGPRPFFDEDGLWAPPEEQQDSRAARIEAEWEKLRPVHRFFAEATLDFYKHASPGSACIVADAGTTPIFNWILYGYGIPAVAFWVAGFMLRKRGDDTPTRMVESGAILFTVLCAFLQIRHFIFRATSTTVRRPERTALQVCRRLALAIGLERLRERTNSIVHDVAARIITVLTLIAIVLGLVVFENPLLTGAPVGGPFFNLILLGYGLPAILMAALGLTVRGKRPQIYSTICAVAAVGLALAYLSLTVTRLYHGPVLDEGAFTDAEGYTYSAVWLAFGVVLLIVGIFLRSQPVRLCSAAVVLLTVGKVFLIDMAGLTGVWRAFSFIGLGLVLVGIGYLYQRLLFVKKPPEAEAL